MTGKFPGLTLPKGRKRYGFYMAVPADLRPAYGGRATLYAALGTSDRRAAEIKAAELRAGYLREFATKRGQPQPVSAATLAGLAEIGAGSPTLSELLPHYVKARKNEVGPKRIEYIERAFTLAQAAMGDVTLDKITRAGVRGFVDALTQNLKAATVNNHIVALSSAFQWAADNSMVSEQAPNPFLRQRKRVVDAIEREPFTGPELQQLVQPSPIRWHILVAAFAGLRASEIVACTIERIDGRRCFVVGKGKTKSARRYVPVHPALKKITESDLRYVNANALSNAFHDWKLKAGIDKPSKVFHSLRHGFVHALERSDCEPDLAAYLAGHSRARSWTFRTYGYGKGLKSAAAAVAKVKYPGLKL